MNKIYCFTASEDHGWVYVAAKTWKEARNLALWDEAIADHMESLIDVHGHIIKNHTTEASGILSVQEICDAGLAWWNCDGSIPDHPEEWCGSEDFEIYDNNQAWKCRECGHTGSIPYI